MGIYVWVVATGYGVTVRFPASDPLSLRATLGRVTTTSTTTFTMPLPCLSVSDRVRASVSS